MALPTIRLLLILALAWAVTAAPTVAERQASGRCASLKKRRSWYGPSVTGYLDTNSIIPIRSITPAIRRGLICDNQGNRHTLSDGEKKAYIGAELCLMSKPAIIPLRGARTLFDQLQAVHVFQMEIAHFVGTFFPFHRLFMYAHEQLLEKECGYTVGQPYWNESIDASSFSRSVVLDPVLGFGGDGAGLQRCIRDGPFRNYTNSIGPGYTIKDHCIQRQVNDRFSALAAQSIVDGCMLRATYMEFWPCVEGGPHGAGHGGIGSQMLNPISSPGDPLFYLHHTWLDSIWARWQDKKPEARLSEIGGNNKMVLGRGGFPGGGGGPPEGNVGPPGGGGLPGAIIEPRPADVPEPQIIGDPGDQTTLSHLIEMYGIVANRTVAEVMDTRGELLCYEYD